MKLNKLLLSTAALAAASTLAHAAPGTWAVDADGTWATTTNWDTGTVATGSAATDIASFTKDITVNRTVTVSGTQIIGNIVFSDGGAFGSAWTISGGTLQLGDNSTTALTPTITTLTNATISSVITGNDGLIKDGAGMLTLTAANTYSGATTINGGTLRLLRATSAANTSGYTVNTNGTLDFHTNNGTWNTPNKPITLDGGTLSMTANSGTGQYGIIPAGGLVTVNSASFITVQAGSNGGGNTSSFFLDGGLAGSADLTITSNTSGLGVILRNSNTNYSGKLTVNGNASTNYGIASGLAIGANVTTPTLTNADIVVNGTMELGFNLGGGMGWGSGGAATGTVQMDALSGTGVVIANFAVAGSRTLSVGNNNGGDTFSGTIANGNLGTVSLIKNGVGTQTLSGTNTYTGTTTINAGTLRLGVNGAINTSAATVKSTATLQTDSTGKTFAGLTLEGGSTLMLAAANGATSITAPLTLTSTPAFTVKPIFSALPTVGNITLVSSTLAPGANGVITTDFTTYGATRVTGSTSIVGNNLVLNVTTAAASLVWNNATADNAWNINASTNFTGADGKFMSFDAVTFNDTATAGSIDLTGTLATSSVTVNTVNTYTFNGTGSIVGAGSLTKQGAGTLVLNNANTYVGGTTISGGTLEIGGAGTLGTSGFYAGNITNTGTLRVSTSANQTLAGIISGTGGVLNKSGTGTLTLSGANTYTGGTFVNAGTLVQDMRTRPGLVTTIGAVTVASGAVYELLSGINTTADSTLFQNNTFSGAGTIRKTGTGYIGIAHTGSNTNGFNGTYDIQSGILGFNSGLQGSGLATVNLSGASAKLDVRTGTVKIDALNGVVGSQVFTSANSGNTLSLGNNNGSGTFNGAIVGGTANLILIKNGTGTQTLIGANSYTGGTTVNGGVLSVSSLANGGIASGIGQSTNVAANLVFGAPAATLRYIGSNDVTTDRGFTMSNGVGGGATIESSGLGALTIDNTVAIAYGTTNQTRVLTLGGTGTAANTFAKTLADNGSGATSFVKAGSGNWTLSGTNTYTGGTTVTAGTLNAGHVNAFGTGTVTVNGGTLALGSTDIAQSAIALNGGSLTGSGYTKTVNFGGAASLTGTFAGTVNLNEYTATLNGTIGTLATGTSASTAITTSGLSVTTLGGQGAFSGGLVTVTGTHNPGNSPGTQTFENGLSYGTGAIVNLEIAANGLSADLIEVLNGLTISTTGAGVALNVSLWGSADYGSTFWDTNHTYDLITVAGGTTGSFASLNISGLGDTTGQGTWLVTQDLTGVTATWTAVPEPSEYGLIGAGALAAVAYVRRRRKHAGKVAA